MSWKTTYWTWFWTRTSWAAVRVQIMWHCVTDETMRATLMWVSVEVVSSVRIVQCHIIIVVVIEVRVTQSLMLSLKSASCNHWCCHWCPRHALSPTQKFFHSSEFSTSCPNFHLVVMLYQSIITFTCSHLLRVVFTTPCFAFDALCAL